MESYWKVVSIPDVELVVGCVASGFGLIFRFSHSSKYTRAVRIRNPKPRYSPQRTSVHHPTRNLCVTVHLCSISSPKCAAVHLNRSILQQVDSRLFILRILFPKRRQYTHPVKMGMSCGVTMIKYILFVFNLVCAVSTWPRAYHVVFFL